ncbi:MAG: alpha/beta hydrolase [Pseudomonadota bacterium]
MTQTTAPTLALQSIDAWIANHRTLTIGPFDFATWVHEDTQKDRPWLLLIHGFPTSSWDWSALWGPLSGHFNLAAIDMLGFGLSDKPQNHHYSLIEQADFQEALLAELGASEAHILCHDYGVSVAQELLARQAERALSFRLQSVCFLNGGIFPGRHRPRLIQKMALTPFGPLISARLSQQKLRNTFNDIFGPHTQPKTREIEGHWQMMTHNQGTRVFHKTMRYMKDRLTYQRRWENAVTQTDLPLRLINGGKDPISGKHLYTYYCENVPRADAVLLEEIGHYPQTEAPQAVLDAFFAFHGLAN